MAQTADTSLFAPEDFSPDDLADESLFDEDEPRTRPGVPRSSAVAADRDPDAEAREIVARVAEKVAIARSVVRIASSVMRSYADQKMAEIIERDAASAFAHVERARKIATAVKEAAKHAASLAAARVVQDARGPAVDGPADGE